MRRVVAGQAELFAATPTIAARSHYEGIGAGGDHALVIDRRCEDIVFAELDAIAREGASFTAISEERGEVTFGDPESPWRVVVDPIDGSLNARRTLPSHSLSVAVASGPSNAHVELGFVHDFGAGDEFMARRGAGATLNGDPTSIAVPSSERALELVGIESAEPANLWPLLEELGTSAYRIRAIGSIAITAGYVAAGRLDGMATTRPCRSVDIAASQLIVREAGGLVELGRGPLASAPLDLGARYQVLAAASEPGLELLRTAQDRVARTSKPGL